MHGIDFPTCSKNILNVALYKNCHVNAEKIEFVEKIYNFSDHTSIRLTVEVLHTKKNHLLRFLEVSETQNWMK